MIRLPSLLYPAAFLCLSALTACGTAEKHLMGDPMNPYPRLSPPRVGEIIHVPTGIAVSSAQMLSIASEARIVYVGETHDNPASHRLELEVLKSLADRYPGRTALGMEMFSRAQQPALDRWIAGELDEKAFLKESRWYENWKMDFTYYRDLLVFARDRHIPVIALNTEKSLMNLVRNKTMDQLSPEERAQLPELDLDDPYQRGLMQAILGDHSHGGMQTEGFVRSQTLRDEFMAESVARFLASPAGEGRHMLVIAGGNHVRHGFGIPRRVFRRMPTSYVVIGGREIDIQADKQNRLMDVELPGFPMVPYDFQVYLNYEDLPKTGVLLGVLTEPASTGRGLLIRDVISGSNAGRAGIQVGDLLLTVDGEVMETNFDLVNAVRQKHAGDHGVLQIERQGQNLIMDVHFQAAAESHAEKP